MIFTKPLMFEFEPIKIANISENGNIAKDFARFDALYENQCLFEILGSCLAKELIDSFEITETSGNKSFTLKDDATEQIKRLVNGYSYTAPETDNSDIFDFSWVWGGCGCGCGSSECTERVWKGFVQTDTILIGNAETTTSKCFVSDYIYYHYLLVNRSITSGSGQQVLIGENSTSVSNFSKRIDRYNEFIFSVVGKVGETSLYRFLQDNKADYPTWKPNCNLNFKTKY